MKDSSVVHNHIVKWEYSPTKRVPTGVNGLDDTLGGGLPSGTCTLVLGGPGTGKTTFGVQFLYKGAIDYNEVGLYLSFDESPPYLRKNMQSFGWDLKKLEEERKLLTIDLSPIRTLPSQFGTREIHWGVGKQDFTLGALIKTIKNEVQEIQPKRIVIDSLAPLVLQFPEVIRRRNAVLELFQIIMDFGITGIMLDELQSTYLRRKLQVEEFLAHGVIIFHRFGGKGEIFKAVQVEKMRGMPHDCQLRPYKISQYGIQVFPRESVITSSQTDVQKPLLWQPLP